MKNVLVLFGGESVERDVSVITGLITLNTLDKEKFNGVPVYVDEKGLWFTGEGLNDISTYKNLDKNLLKRVVLINGDNTLYLMKGKKLKPLFKVACAINCLHGGTGEDGSFSGIMKTHKIPFVAPGVLPSAIAMDKETTKYALKGIGVKTLPFKVVKSLDEAYKLKIDYPVIVKPARLGSSVGVAVAENKDRFIFAVASAFRFDDKVIIEPRLSGFTEINCACYRAENGLNISECERPIGKTEVLSFEDKYKSGKRQFPAKIEKCFSDKIKRITGKIYNAFGFSGVIRIDYFLTDNGEIFVNEINSIPGSMAYYLFCNDMEEFKNTLTLLIAQAEKEFSEEGTLTKKFNTSLLSIKGAKGSKRL